MGVAVAAAAALAPGQSATATPDRSDTAPQRIDDRPDEQNDARRAAVEEAVSQVLQGEAKPVTKGSGKSVQISPGQWAQYGLQSTDSILTFLIEFGDQVDSRFPTAPTGPQHNEIPEPDRAVDNTTYWVDDFNRDHFQDMFFGDGESMSSVYKEMSSGRYTVKGDTSEWVTVPYNSASYGQTESQTDMTRFIQDGATAWYEHQKASGKTDADITAYLREFDQWDRFDYDKDGVFTEPDGYIDHFQAVHAGEGEEAGAPEWTIWSHRWSVGQRSGGGPEWNRNGGVQIGNTGLWIRDYTTEPENGGLGVFAHEFGHDLGLPDLYDTSGGENGTGFWTLMSSGSWLGHGQDSIGTTPNHMGAWEKLQLGWLDYVTVPHDAVDVAVMLGPSAHATKKQQALVVTLPKDANGRDRYYIAENRQYTGYDATLKPGPYNFGWGVTKPNWVEHFPYQDGLLVSYWNTAVSNNNTRTHPGTGRILPVDARPMATRWSDGALTRNRIQTFDSTFGVQATDPISLHREVGDVMTTFDLPAQAPVPVFDDSDPNRYYDPANPQGSVKVAGVGVKIRVVQSNQTGKMTVKVNG
ncbi:protease [Knoellia subterranea KCTC 19937]|uniref:Protease n=1 Tax=Knoellia subterranea KCTC 19937 TaxID=1385521 RepID=A0A0A0JP12_9MICO|nr:protease [Knoellia subterranea KCTC 19937]